MTNVWQLLAVAICSLIFGSFIALAKENSPTSVSYNSGRKATSQSKGLIDLASAATSPSSLATSYGQQLNQPNVYHTITDQTAASSRLASPVQSTTTTVGDLSTAAGHHHGHAHGKYYEYREVPKKKTWKFGYKRGNHKHTIERHEHGKAGKHPHFKTKVKWHDKKSKGKGIHLWDYNHHDKKHYHHG